MSFRGPKVPNKNVQIVVVNVVGVETGVYHQYRLGVTTTILVSKGTSSGFAVKSKSLVKSKSHSRVPPSTSFIPYPLYLPSLYHPLLVLNIIRLLCRRDFYTR